MYENSMFKLMHLWKFKVEIDATISLGFKWKELLIYYLNWYKYES